MLAGVELEKAIQVTKKPSERFKGIDKDKELVLRFFPNTFWERIRSESGSVEAKITYPDKLAPERRLLLFEPGFPGDGSSRLERLWARDLSDNDFTIVAARHNGTIINGQFSGNYIFCPPREAQARKLPDERSILGEYENPSLREWLIEPLVMMEAFVPHFDEVTLVSHSFGSPAMLSSLIDYTHKHPEHKHRFKRFVSLSGTLGKYTGDKWEDSMHSLLKEYADKHPENAERTKKLVSLTRTVGNFEGDRRYASIPWIPYMDTDAMRNRVSVGDAEENYQAILSASRKIHDHASSIPDIDLFFVYAHGREMGSTDLLVNPRETIDMMRSLGRGHLLIDQSEMTDSRTGKDAHDMDNLDLPKLVDPKWHPQKRVIKLA